MKIKIRCILTKYYPKVMCDTPPGGAWTLTEVWVGSSLPAPEIMSFSFLGGGGLDGSVGSLKSDDFCRAS